MTKEKKAKSIENLDNKNSPRDYLVLSFCVGNKSYLIDCSRVVEVVPKVELRKLPHAQEYVAGLLNYRGTVVPVIDMSILLLKRNLPDHLSTRIILIYFEGKLERKHILGLLAEKVLDVKKIAGDSLEESGIELAEAPYLGKVEKESGELSQIIEVEDLLPESLQKKLFKKQ